MNDATLARGIWAATLTPFDERLEPDAAKAAPYYSDLLARGCDGLNVLGTSGEAMSIPVKRRMRFVRELAERGVPLERCMVGTGAQAVEDAAALTEAALECGARAALVVPPTYYRNVSDDGVMRFFDELFRRVRTANPRVVLYNFPQLSGVTFRPALVERLMDAYPGAIAGLKDSSNDAGLQRELVARRPALAVYPSSESGLREAAERGMAGCISGSVALWPQRAAAVWHGGGDARRLAALRDGIAALPLIAAVRYAVAARTNDPAWERTIPPLEPLSVAQRAAVDALLAL